MKFNGTNQMVLTVGFIHIGPCYGNSAHAHIWAYVFGRNSVIFGYIKQQFFMGAQEKSKL